MRRGDIRWYTFRPPDKKRPVLILSRGSAIEELNEVTVAPITSTVRDIPTEVFLSKADGMNRDCAINLDYLQTVSKSKIDGLITIIDEDTMEKVHAAQLFALGFPFRGRGRSGYSPERPGGAEQAG